MLTRTTLYCVLQAKDFQLIRPTSCVEIVQSMSNDRTHDIAMFLHRTDGFSNHMASFTNITSLFRVKDMPFHVHVAIQDGNVRPASRFLVLFSNLHTYFFFPVILYSCIFLRPFQSCKCVGILDDDFDSRSSGIGKKKAC